MKKILFIWNESSPNGNIGTYLPSVYAAKSIEFDIDIAMNFSEALDKLDQIEKVYGIHLIDVPINRNPTALVNYDAYKQLVTIMKNGKYDLIHCNTPMGSVLGRLAAKKAGISKVFYMNRGFHFYKGAPMKNWIIYYNVEKIFARFLTDAIATINPIDFKYAEKFRLRHNSNLKVALPGPGIDLSKFIFSDEDRKLIRNQFNFKQDDVVVISVGELSDRKNFKSIIEAISLLHCPHLFYMIVGSGEKELELKNLVNKLNLTKNIIFVGRKENVATYYSAADIFAIPSLNEGFGRVGIEAMNVGLPIISSNVQGINMYSIDGKTGYKYNPRDVEGYAKGIETLMNSKQLRNEMSAYNLKFAKEFSMQKTAKLISNIYLDLLNSNF